eukprot:Gb_34945 [translate_table: standard]
MMSSNRTASQLSPLVFFLICASLLHASLSIVVKKGPTAPEIISHKEFTDALSKVWSESSIGNGVYQIRGGWVYADPKDPQKISISFAPKTLSNPGTVKDVVANPESVEIKLDNPDKYSEAQVKMGYKVVGDFHTHPFPHVYQFPGDDDRVRAYDRGVPAVVLSCTGIIYYGPDHRFTLLLGPSGYPGGTRNIPTRRITSTAPIPSPATNKLLSSSHHLLLHFITIWLVCISRITLRST